FDKLAQVFSLYTNDGPRGAIQIDVLHRDMDAVELRVAESFTVGFSAERQDRADGKPQPGQGTVRLVAADATSDSRSVSSDRGASRFDRVFRGRYQVESDHEEPG